MRIETIVGKSFGELNGQKLEFKPGLNIISGPNESGKSTWHSALHSLICGIRHRGGGRTEEKKRFRESYFPWRNTGEWAVHGTILNDRDEVFTVFQDLESSTGSQVLRSGANVTAEFEHEGNPDMSSLIGLRRETFAAVAVIRQGEILKIVEGENHALVDAVQKVASTAGDGGTAAAALDILTNYKAEKVGTDRKNSTKPRRKALEAQAEARKNLDIAKKNQENFQSKLKDRGEEQVKAKNQAKQIEFFSLQLESVKLRALEDRVKKYSDEIKKYGSEEPAHQINSEAIAEVNQLIAKWNHKETPQALPTPTSGDLKKDLDNLKDPIRDDSANIRDVSDKEIVEAVQGYEIVLEKLSELDKDIKRLSTKLLDRASSNHQEQPTVMTSGSDRRRGKNLTLIFAGLALAMVGGFISTKSPIPGLIAIALGVSVSLVGYLRKSREPNRASIIQERTNNVYQSDPLEDEIKLRQQQTSKLIVERDSAFTTLKQVFSSHGEVIIDDQYMTNVINVIFKEKKEKIQEKRVSIKNKISETLERENKIANINKSNGELYKNLRKVTENCGILTGLDATEDDLVSELKGWLGRQGELQEGATEFAGSKARRESILDGQTLDGLERSIKDIRGAASSPLPELPENRTLEDIDRDIKDAERLQNEALRRISTFDGEIGTIRSNSPNVADCEQELELAKFELERVDELEKDLDLAVQFLKDAEIDVNNDIAPVIQRKLSEYIPKITQGRYSQVIVDPGNLKVKVQIGSGVNKDAENLSFGTAEQVYLILRVALIEHLTGNTESCPIFCDDITVHADTARKGEILKFLLELSRKQQIILFSQEDFVRDWARENLQSDRDSLILLPVH